MGTGRESWSIVAFDNIPLSFSWAGVTEWVRILEVLTQLFFPESEKQWESGCPANPHFSSIRIKPNLEPFLCNFPYPGELHVPSVSSSTHSAH